MTSICERSCYTVVASGQLDGRVKIYTVRKRLADSVNTRTSAHTVLVPGLFVERCLVFKPKENLAQKYPARSVRGFTFRRVHGIAESDYLLRHVCPSGRPNGTTRLPLDGFPLNLTFEYFWKIC
jgi:hypothetical protein